MWHYLLILILLNNINCIEELNGTFKNDYFSSEYITPNNDILIYDPIEYNLYLSKPIDNSPQYNPPNKIKPKNFTQDKPETLYFNFVNLEPQIIQVSYFNETNGAFFNYTEDSKEYSYISIEEIGNGNFAILFNANETSINNNSISIATFDFYAKSDEERFKITKTYILNDKTKRVYSNCITTKGNNIVCALTKKDEYNKLYYYNYTLILLNNEDETISNEIYIYNDSESIYEDDDYDYDYDDDYASLYSTKFNDEYKYNLIYKFFKIILLDSEKFLYCYMNNSGIYCGLAAIKNNKIEVVYKGRRIFESFKFYSNLARTIFDAIKYQYNKFILCLATSSEMKFATLQLSYDDTYFTVRTDNYYSGLYNPYYFYVKLLKNKNNELILFLMNGQSSYSTTLKGYIDELEYISCKNSSISLYNADIKTVKFTTYPSFLIDSEKSKYLYLFKIGNEVNSLFLLHDVPVKLNTQLSIYDYIYYNFTYEDYNYIKNHTKYEVGFTNSFEAYSQKCKVTLNFYKCKKECEFCNEDGKCWDQNWKFVYFKSNFEKMFFIIPCSIIVMLIVLALFTFAKCGVKEVMPNYGGENPAPNELPLIS